MSTRPRACLILLLALASLAVFAAPAPAQNNPAGYSSRMQVPRGWQVYRGQSGLVVMHPAGWQVSEYSGGGFLALRTGTGGGADAFVLAQPMTIQGQAASVVRGLGQVLPSLFPGVQVSRLRTPSAQPDVAEARLDYAVKGRPFQGMALCFRQGKQGMLYAAAALREAWPGLRQQAVYILRSFLYTAPAAAAAPAGAPAQVRLPAMVPWRDPAENAFSARVPAGWRVQGGLRRFHAVDVRPELVAASPDGKITVRLGDARVPPMAQANPVLARSGFPEGSTYSPGYGVQQMVLRYLPGARFATQFYLPRLVGRVSQVQARNLPEVARRAQAVYQQAGLNMQVDTGEVSFSSQGQQGLRQGYLFVQTFKVEMPGMPGMGTWHVEILYGYLAQPDQEPLARAVLNAMAQSFQIDPGWMARQAQTAGQVSGIVTRTNQQISGIIRDTFRYRQQVQDRAMERFDRVAIRGKVLVEDPNTGQRFEVQGGSNYYWRRGGEDKFVGTQTDTRPYAPNHWLERMTVLD
ncbi:MAG: hypothetical protein C4525_11125 [Desulfarculus sp.]|nr:MAG: hypothetical protein C4525_11125 [Desulfarculus sp.]